MSEVEYRPIPGWEDKYVAGSDGRIYAINYHRQKGNFRAMDGNVSRHGYLLVRLSRNCASKAYSVHRLVALAWIPNPENLPVVNHIDFNRLNNAPSNLEWCSAAQNVIHSKKHKRYWQHVGEKHHNSKLSDADVLSIRARMEAHYYSGICIDMAKEFGVTKNVISLIWLKKTRAHLWT